MNKRFISVLTALCIGLSGAAALPAGADNGPVISADNNSGLGGPCGENVTWEFFGDGTLVFSGSGEMGEAEAYSSDWDGFHNVGEVKNVIIEEGITSIVDYAFFTCKSLTSITIPSSIKSIGYAAFYMCSSLESIDIPDSVTSIDSYAFDNCVNLNSITLPKNVKTIGKVAFEGCPNIKSVEIPASVKAIGDYAFGYESYVVGNKVDGFTITGYSGTAAEKYAIDNDFKFVSLGYQIGDIDQNGEVDVNDLIIMQKAVAGWKVGDEYRSASDIDRDGDVDVDDLVLMQKKVAGWKIKK